MKGKLFKTGNQYLLRSEANEVLAISDGTIGGKKLSIKNCQTIELNYDLDELVENHLSMYDNSTLPYVRKDSFLEGAKTILEILGDKKFSEEDMWNMFYFGDSLKNKIKSGKIENKHMGEIFDDYIKSLQQTEWDVEIVMDRDCYSSAGRCDKLTMADCIICTPVTYLKDADGCLILKRI